MVDQLQVGQATNVSYGVGTTQPLRGGNLGELVVQELHGRYAETARNKNLFSAYAAGVLLSASGTSMTGLMLWNGSTSVNLYLQKIALMVSVTSATMTGIALGTGTGQVAAPTSQTAITKSGCTFLGGPSSLATPMNAGTFTVAPTAALLLMHNTAAIATTGEDNTNIDLEGSIIVPPQGYVALIALGAASAAAAVTASMMWEEVPV